MIEPTDATFRAWLKRKLLDWFRENQRKVPWRDDRDPYRIWISEVMLQQTQVATVVPFFNRFLDALPDLDSLANADEQQVLQLWSGLGYYRRARHLLQAAQQILAEHDGVFPTDPKTCQSLPGMGRYTVNAILSQAFDQRLPILEANTERVLCRLFGRKEDPRKAPLKGWLWQTAEDILPAKKHIGEMNQALMELGALVCTVTSPSCAECPLRAKCEARKQGLQESIPLRARPPEKIDVQEIALVIRKKNQILLVQRPSDAKRWASLWECPHLAIEKGESQEQAVERLLSEIGFQATIGKEITTIEHGVTRYRITMYCLSAKHSGGQFRKGMYSAHRWLNLDEIDELPLSSPQKRLIKQIEKVDLTG